MPRPIPLTQGRFALIDDADYGWLCQYRWLYHANGYAIRIEKIDGKRRFFHMHREIMQAQRGQIVDHIDTDRLNNTRANLRIVTKSQNMWNRSANEVNSSPFKGVSAHARGWYARIKVNNRAIHLGYFDDPKMAAMVYDAAASYFFSVYARVNFPDSETPPTAQNVLWGVLERLPGNLGVDGKLPYNPKSSP